ncbi:MAG: hypothetical protein KatS3mg131_3829 [Candidatus Tectimicrobiota bacterium]|nr:MAG: hypothetical protein KatS3mg131_3829 [Candidatus Tectomicrobia bacterium]
MSGPPLLTPPQLRMEIRRLIAAAGGSAEAELLEGLMEAVLRCRHLERGDLKILHRTVRELRYAFRVFERYRGVRKVTVFGSARTQPTAPTYRAACAFARRIVEAGFMVITGAGDGIMKAAQEGAGREHSFGLNILLPFEQEPNEIIVNDAKLIYFKYFFTRKLIFVKETHAFALFPGGFGTHDEAYEALTLLQTGKSPMMPVVFLDAPGGTFWRDWYAFIENHMVAQGLISPADLHLFKVTDDVDEAVAEITSFYRNYHSARYVDGELVIRVQHPISDALLARLNRDFRDILTQGEITASGPIGDDAEEVPELPRLRLWFDRASYGRLRQMIDVINQY